MARYRKRLADVDRLSTHDGAHVLHLATLLATGPHTAAGAASLSKELRTAMDAVLATAPKQADAFDELEERRRLKANSA